MMTEPLYPEINVQLTGNDGNAFAVLANVKREMRTKGVPQEVIEGFLSEAMSGDYDHLLQTCAKWVSVS